MTSPFKISGWPIVNIEAIPKEGRGIFNRKRRAVELLKCSDKSPSQVSSATGVKPSQQRRLLERCETLHPDGHPWGYRAMLPNQKLCYKRRNPEGEGSRGKSGLCKRLLTNPAIRAAFNQLLTKGYEVRPGVYVKLKGARLYQEMRQILINNGVTKDQWPFTTADRGDRTFQRYIADAKKGNRTVVVLAEGERSKLAAVARESHGLPSSKVSRFLARVQLDGKMLGVFGTLLIPTASGMPRHVLAEDLWVVDMVGDDPTIPLAVVLALRGSYGEAEVLECIATAQGVINMPREGERPWLPVHFFPEMRYFALDKILLDRALAHRANDLAYVLGQVHNAWVQFDKAHVPQKRPHIESLHSYLRQRGYMLIPEAYWDNKGRYQRDKAIQKARKMEITLDVLWEAIQNVYRDYLMRPRPEHSGQSQMDYLRWYLSEEGTVIRKLPVVLQEPINVLRNSFTATVRKAEGRVPHVNYMYGEYRGPVIGASEQWVGKKLNFVANTLDARTAIAFYGNKQIDVVKVQSPWNKSPHSFLTRQHAQREFMKAKLVFDRDGDAVLQYRDRCRHKVLSDSEPGSTSVKELARVDREVRQGGGPPMTADPVKPPAVRSAPEPTPVRSTYRLFTR